MKNPIMYCTLAALGLSQNTLEKLDASDCHFYQIINEHNVPVLWEQLVERRSTHAVREIQAAQTEWQNHRQAVLDSVCFLVMGGADDKLVQTLRRNGINTVSQLDYMINNQMKLPSYWRKAPEKNLEIIQRYRDWQMISQAAIDQELETIPEVDLSATLQHRVNSHNEQRHMIKWLGIEQVPNTLMAFLDLDFKKKDFLVGRLSGLTLQEIGNAYGLTRERVRQIVDQIVKRLPLFDDVEKYKKLVLSYDIQLDQFLNYTQGTPEIFEYIQIKYKRPKNLKSVDQYLLSLNKVAPEVLAERLNCRQKFVNHANRIVDLTTSHVIDEILFTHRNVFTRETLLVELDKFFRAHGQAHGPELSERALQAQVERQPHIIQRTNGYFRYYELALSDVSDYLDEINALFEVADGIYGIDYFFEQNQALMAEIDIRESSELANLLKALGYEQFDRLNTIVRQSQVYIGRINNDEASKDKFYLDILLQFDGQTADDVADYLQASYQLKRVSVWAYINKVYKKYIHNNTITMNAKLPTNPEFYAKMQIVLDQSLYPFEQVAGIIKLIDPAVQVSPLLVDKLGYVERSGLLMRKDCHSLDDALKKLWLVDDYVPTDELKAYPNRWFTLKAYQLELRHDLIAMDPTRYLTIRGLNKLGLTKADIDNFLQEVVAFVDDDVFFTWKSLVDAGFESSFMAKTGFSDEAYERLIFTIPSIRTIKTRGVIFINETHPTPVCPPLVNFLAQELGQQPCDIDDFLLKINHKFNLNLDKAKVLEKLSKGQLAYAPETQRLYPDQQTMYADVYQGMGIEI